MTKGLGMSQILLTIPRIKLCLASLLILNSCTQRESSLKPKISEYNLQKVNTWGIQLTGYASQRLSNIASAEFDMAVVDPFDDEGKPWSINEIAAVTTNKLLIAYLSMGAAESYRRYWQTDWKVGQPSWILAEDPDWPGNFDIAYWNPAWKAIALAELDKVIAQGFNGVYMDLIDAYNRNPNRASARADMVKWVCEISAHAKKIQPNFLIIPQNASELIGDTGYADCVDATAQEETFMYAMNTPTETSRQADLLQTYKLWITAKKPVFTLEYADNPDLIQQTYAKARANNLVPYVSLRNLDTLIPSQ